MQFRVCPPSASTTHPAGVLQPPAITPLPAETVTRQVALIEMAGVGFDAADEPVEGPVEALLGTVADGVWTERMWSDSVTENPAVGASEVWEMYNTTADAHPMHIHEITFEVVNREGLVTTGEEGEVVQPIQLLDGNITPPAMGERPKDTVIALHAEVTRVRARSTRPGESVPWHIVEHEDNETMRPSDSSGAAASIPRD